ncbi:MAG: DUF6678 family protein [Acutalibacteraceae bacterium]
MNDTKWNEIFKAFYYGNHDFSISYRTKYINEEVGYYVDDWEIFGSQFSWHKKLEWLEIELTEENKEFVIKELKRIHVPGTVSNGVATIYGYRQDVDYI